MSTINIRHSKLEEPVATIKFLQETVCAKLEELKSPLVIHHNNQFWPAKALLLCLVNYKNDLLVMVTEVLMWEMQKRREVNMTSQIILSLMKSKCWGRKILWTKHLNLTFQKFSSQYNIAEGLTQLIVPKSCFTRLRVKFKNQRLKAEPGFWASLTSHLTTNS